MRIGLARPCEEYLILRSCDLADGMGISFILQSYGSTGVTFHYVAEALPSSGVWGSFFIRRLEFFFYYVAGVLLLSCGRSGGWRLLLHHAAICDTGATFHFAAICGMEDMVLMGPSMA